MPSSTAPSTAVRFKDWEIRPQERVLLVRGEVANIGSRAFDVLLALVERRGQVVSKAELLDLAWRRLVVEENNVSVQIATLRRLLGAKAIATVAGVGYRLSAVPDGEPPPAPAARPAVSGAPGFALLGRDLDLDALHDRVGVLPLVSIIGTGGVGKTSLARALLARRAAASGGEVHWVDLAPLRDGDELEPLLAKTLGVEIDSRARAREDLVSALSQTQALLALDNCEHVVGAVAGLVRRALVDAPSVRWMVTSQEPLHLLGETVYRLGPLDVPEPGATLDEALGHGALALLCQRTAAADRYFALDASNLATAIDLCRQLDGLPLAIEMAAARVATLGLHGVHEQLEHRLRLLAGPRDGPARQHDLRSTLDWSHGLLAPAEQKLFRRLEPFLGGFSAAMAQQIGRDPEDGPDALSAWQALDALSALVDKSLVQRAPGTPPRFFLYESARDYARQRLADAGETEMIRRRHAHIVAAAFDNARADHDRLRDEQWTTLYVPERRNVRAALAWACAAREPDLLARLVAALGQIDTFLRGQAEIVRCEVPMDVLELALPSLRAVACLEFSWAHYHDGNRKTGTVLAQRALEDFRMIGDSAGAYRALSQLVRLYDARPGMAQEATRARAELQRIDSQAVPLRTRLFCAITAGLPYEGQETLDRLRGLEEVTQRSGYDTLAALCRAHITDELLIARRHDEVVASARRFLEAGEPRPRVKAAMLLNQVLALVQLGRAAEAREPARAVLRIMPSLHHLLVASFALAAARAQRWVDAALLAGYSERVRRERDERSDEAEAAAIAETAELLRRGLPSARLDELMRSGAALAMPDALALALSAPATAAAPAAAPGPAS